MERKESPGTVREVMRRNPPSLEADDTVEVAAKLMRLSVLGILPVTERGRLVGVVTDRDLVMRSTAEGTHPAQETVRFAMSEAVASCREENTVGEAAEIMAKQGVRRLPVLDEEGRLVGVISLEVVAQLEGAEKLAGDALRKMP